MYTKQIETAEIFSRLKFVRYRLISVKAIYLIFQHPMTVKSKFVNYRESIIEETIKRGFIVQLQKRLHNGLQRKQDVNYFPQFMCC